MMTNRVCLPLRVVTYDSITFAGRGTFTFVLCFSPWRRSSEVSHRFSLEIKLFFKWEGTFSRKRVRFSTKGTFSSQEHFLPVRENFSTHNRTFFKKRNNIKGGHMVGVPNPRWMLVSACHHDKEPQLSQSRPIDPKLFAQKVAPRQGCKSPWACMHSTQSSYWRGTQSGMKPDKGNLVVDGQTIFLGLKKNRFIERPDMSWVQSYLITSYLP